MNNNANCETVYIHGPRGIRRETYPTVSVGEAYPLLPIPCPGNSILELYSVDSYNNEVDPFNLVVNCDNGGSITMRLTALDVVNHIPIILMDGDEPHCICFGRIEVDINDVVIVDELDNVLGKLDEKIPLNKIPFSIKLKAKNGDIVRLKTHVIKL